MLVILGFLLFNLLSASALTISRHGVTWSIDGAPQSGTYANGDPWVVGPVNISNISPRPAAGRHGTVVNPSLGREQGFDDRISSHNKYVDALNVGRSLPLAVAVDKSVVSSISDNDNVQWAQVKTYVVLTVVKSAPAAGAFRPPYMGDGSRASAHNKADLDYGKLKRLPKGDLSPPALADLEARFDRCWYEQDLTWTGRYMHTKPMGRNGYGKNMALQTGDAGLSLQLDYTNAQKEKLLISIVQYGIDIHGIIEDGGKWNADGGHNSGRLMPLLIAAVTLDDAAMKANLDGTRRRFQEFGQTFFVSQADVDRPRYTQDGRPRLPYTAADIGMPEWGEKHPSQPERDGNNWNAYYRDIGGSVLTSVTMVARVMGVRALLNWEPLFLYAVRHIEYETGDTYRGEFDHNSTPGWHKRFYAAHKNNTGGGPSDPVPPPPTGPSPTNTPAPPMTPQWRNVPIPEQRGDFTVTFVALPGGTALDAVVGLSSAPAAAYADLAAIVRFSVDGIVDARNGSGYRAVEALTYGPLEYVVTMQVSMTTATYSVSVTPPGAAVAAIARDFAFRTEQSSASKLSNLAIYSVHGPFEVANATVAGKQVIGSDVTPSPSLPEVQTTTASPTPSTSQLASSTAEDDSFGLASPLFFVMLAIIVCLVVVVCVISLYAVRLRQRAHGASTGTTKARIPMRSRRGKSANGSFRNSQNASRAMSVRHGDLQAPNAMYVRAPARYL